MTEELDLEIEEFEETVVAPLVIPCSGCGTGACTDCCTRIGICP